MFNLISQQNDDGLEFHLDTETQQVHTSIVVRITPQEAAPPIANEERQEINDAIANLADKIQNIGSIK